MNHRIRTISVTPIALVLCACGTIKPQASPHPADTPFVMFSMSAQVPLATHRADPIVGGLAVAQEKEQGPLSPPGLAKAAGSFLGPWIVRFRALNLDNIPSYDGQTVTLRLFPDLTLSMRIDKWSPRENGHMLLGQADERGPATLAIDATNRAAGTIELENGNVLIFHTVDGQQYVLEVDPRKFLDEKPYLASPGDRPKTQPPASGEAGVLRIMLVSGNDPDVCAELNSFAPFFEQQFNTVFSSNGSSVPVKISVFCSEDALIGATLDASLANLSQSINVDKARTKAQADLVSLIVGNATDGSGIAQYNFPILPTDSNRPFSVVLLSPAVGELSLVHEVGHNLGMQHDRYVLHHVDTSPCNYGSFVLNGACPEKRTIMAEPDYCADCATCTDCTRCTGCANPTGCGRIPVFSTPPLSGVDCSDPVNGANNRAQLLVGAVEASRFFFP
ncbi:MAG TPA: zinc-dependent metalloprotease family protein [Thermoanaerobaculia bacterium]|jgi:hypothetical protein|nr:zinc-dependent metalloprotease family protein [Thermoanaerobaculia bacterium]